MGELKSFPELFSVQRVLPVFDFPEKQPENFFEMMAAHYQLKYLAV